MYNQRIHKDAVSNAVLTGYIFSSFEEYPVLLVDKT